jgi:DNA (cytosine-5)-methyltransferase 1
MFQGLFVDGFAGGGGASTGIARAIGRDVDIAINHDPMAIAVHKANHPTTEHHCQDIRVVWPSAATRLRRVAGAWFSPDCKEHSKAKGGPVKDRNIRQLPWEIIPWLKETRPTVGYVENVEEMQMWGPLDENGHVIKELRGKEFRKWIRSIRSLGYRVAHKELRACDYGAPTSRKRLYIIMRCDGLPIVWPKRSHGPANDNDVLRGKLLPYRTAADCIDWSIPVRSIFDRVRPLKENTERRIAHGVMRYVVNAARPFIIPVTHAGDIRAHDVQDPLRTITTANGGEFAAVDATLAPHITKFRTGSVGSDMGEPMPTVTANGEPARPAGATPLGIAGATLVGLNNTSTRAARAFDVNEPVRTITSAGQFGAVEAAMAPLLVETAHGDVDSSGKKRGRGHRSIEESMPTQTTSNNAALVSAFLSRFHKSNTNGGRGDPAKPLGTVTSGGMHHAVVGAHMAQFNNNPGGTVNPGHDLRKPVSTIGTKGPVQAVVHTTMIEEGSLPPDMMAKATRVAAFLVKYYGTAVGSPVDQPFDTVTTLPRYAVVTVTIDAVTYVIVDIGMRMLTPRELARAQGFPENYILDPVTPQLIRGKIVYKPLTIAAQIRMIGNSVCPDVAEALVTANQPGIELRMAA